MTLMCRNIASTIAASVICLACAAATANDEITAVPRVEPTGEFTQYQSNRAPLAPSRLVELPFCAVRPAGWLKKQLELQADGFHGHLTEIAAFLKKKDNAWLDPKERAGNHGWEEVPYWLKGYIGAAYLLKNKRMIDESQIWIEGALKSQQPDGWFGPGKGRTGAATNLKGREDLWPNMIMLFCLQTYYDCTGDARVIDLMRKYFKYLEALPEEKFLIGYWPSMRGGDQLYSILWLYNRTGDKWLLDLARKTHKKTARWDEDVINWHNVNIAQAFREPAVYGVFTRNPSDFAATERDWTKVRAMYGQVPGGMFGPADENARPGYNGPRQAVETCGMVEEMLSDEILTAITGEPAWGDRCENVAFNSLPAALTADFKALRYLTAPNQPESDHMSKSPGIQNGGPMYCMDPHDHRCCQHNCGHGWPYLTAHLWYASPGDGLAAMFYAPCEADVKVAGGATVHIVEKTRYPFDEKIELTIDPSAAVRFPLYLRIPAWCGGAKIAINGQEKTVELPAGKIARIEREWKPGDKLMLTLPMQVRVKFWNDNRGFASVDRGPLTFSVNIKERYQREGGTDEWPAWDLYPDSHWNYGLVLDGENTTEKIEVHLRDWPASDQPFSQDTTPVTLTVRAKRIDSWRLDRKHLVKELIDSPVKSSAAVETITLVPMGGARLRITAIPDESAMVRPRTTGLPRRATTSRPKLRTATTPTRPTRSATRSRREEARTMNRSRGSPGGTIAGLGGRVVGSPPAQAAAGGIVTRGLLVRRHRQKALAASLRPGSCSTRTTASGSRSTGYPLSGSAGNTASIATSSTGLRSQRSLRLPCVWKCSCKTSFPAACCAFA